MEKPSCNFCEPIATALLNGMKDKPLTYQTQQVMALLQNRYVENNCGAVCVAKFGALARILGGQDTEE